MEKKGLKIHKITARDLPDLWFQAVHDILEHGRRFKIDRGSYAEDLAKLRCMKD